MLTPKQFADAWGKDDLVLLSASTLQDVKIPQADKDFLGQVGLPQTAVIPTGGAGDFTLLPNDLLLSYYQQHYLRLGFIKYEPEFGHETYFCIERTTSAIYLLDNQDSDVYYVNSSISAFAEALLAYRSFVEPNGNDLLKDDDSRRLRRLKREIKAFDPKAMANRANYWPLMLADLANQI